MANKAVPINKQRIELRIVRTLAIIVQRIVGVTGAHLGILQ